MPSIKPTRASDSNPNWILTEWELWALFRDTKSKTYEEPFGLPVEPGLFRSAAGGRRTCFWLIKTRTELNQSVCSLWIPGLLNHCSSPQAACGKAERTSPLLYQWADHMGLLLTPGKLFWLSWKMLALRMSSANKTLGTCLESQSFMGKQSTHSKSILHLETSRRLWILIGPLAVYNAMP